VARLAEEARQVAERDRKECQALANRLRERLGQLDVDPGSSDRLKTASAVAGLLERLGQEEGTAVVLALAAGPAETSEDAMGKSREHAAAVGQRLAATNWTLLEEARRHAGDDAEAAAVRDDLTAALTQDEHVTGLAAELRAIEERATRLLGRLIRKRDRKPDSEPPPRLPGASEGTTQARSASEGNEQGLDVEQAQALLLRLKEGLGKGQRLSLEVRWRIDGADA
jgi:hypothetical protein